MSEYYFGVLYQMTRDVMCYEMCCIMSPVLRRISLIWHTTCSCAVPLFSVYGFTKLIQSIGRLVICYLAVCSTWCCRAREVVVVCYLNTLDFSDLFIWLVKGKKRLRIYLLSVYKHLLTWKISVMRNLSSFSTDIKSNHWNLKLGNFNLQSRCSFLAERINIGRVYQWKRWIISAGSTRIRGPLLV